MADDLPSNAQEPDRSPAGTPAEHRAVDRRWRLWAAGVVVLALSLAGLLGLVIIPAGQREDAGLTMSHAMRRTAGRGVGLPAGRRPPRGPTPPPGSPGA